MSQPPSGVPDPVEGDSTQDALVDELRRTAAALGFARLGVARAEPLGPEAARLRDWLAKGRHGSMRYMETTVDVRANPQHEGMLPAAESVIVLAMSYAAKGEPAREGLGRIARYARGRDYHNVLYKRGKKVARLLRARGYVARVAVDSMPVFERAWAERAGIGFVGKNCCLIIPGFGSHVFLSAIVTNAKLMPDAPMAPRCGDCDLCLRRCPTRAFAGPRELDARRCISYLTIEHRGSIAENLRPDMQSWLFGCDDCQDVCPFNHGADHGNVPAEFEAREGREVPIAEWLEVDDARFDSLTRGSPLRRAGREGLARNAAIVLGNSLDRRHLPVLEQSAERHDSIAVREASAWAKRRIERHE